MIDELINCMLDVICTQGETVKIGNEKKNRQMVIDRYFKIDSSEIGLILEKYKEQQHKITHKSSYLKTMLYNVKQEFDHHITNDLRVKGML